MQRRERLYYLFLMSLLLSDAEGFSHDLSVAPVWFVETRFLRVVFTSRGGLE